jgi:cytochrome c oxidase subunit II
MTLAQDRRKWLLGLGGACALGLAGVARPEEGERVIAIVARKWEFVPAEVALSRGEPVILELTSPDTAMGFALENLGMRADLMPGKVVRLRLQPEKAGPIGFYCDVFCGSGHEGMDGVLMVSD